MERTIKILNDMLKKRVVADFAIGGAMALAFYTEPTVTYDLDVFVFLAQDKGKPILVSLEPIYNYCHQKKYTIQQEHVLIEGIAVQFIPVYNELVKEALKNALQKKYGNIKVRVIGLEYLMAIMLQTGRPKDFARLTAVLDNTLYDKTGLVAIIKKHGLSNAWKKIAKKR